MYYEKTPFKKQMRERTSSEFSVGSEATVPLSDSGDTGMFCIRALCLGGVQVSSDRCAGAV